MNNNNSPTKNSLSTDDSICQLCSSTSPSKTTKRFSSFVCDHCHLSLCYNCFETHFNQTDAQFQTMNYSLETKQQLLTNFEEHCLRTLNSTFDEIVNDLENLRREALIYIKQQFQDAKIVLNGLRSQKREEINNIERHLDVFSSPKMLLKMSTYPRNKLELHCQLFNMHFAPSKRFTTTNPGKIVASRCLCTQMSGMENEKIDVDTEIDEIRLQDSSHKFVQTESSHRQDEEPIENDDDEDDDDQQCLSIRINDSNDRTETHKQDFTLSKQFVCRQTVSTQHEVDRIASDGRNLLYFCEKSKILCYVIKIEAESSNDGNLISKEVVYRWPHYPILDLIYCSPTSQFICATRAGIFTCNVESKGEQTTIDVQLRVQEYGTYVRLSTDKNSLWIWIDTPYSSQLGIYSPTTFECFKKFDLNDYPKFTDNSTSFCVFANRLATVFQFKQRTSNVNQSKKYFHLTLCDSYELNELLTIHLGECDIDHEIRAHSDGMFFVTNGKRKLWIINTEGKAELIKLQRTGRALTIHTKNEIFIANGTRKLQLVKRL